MTRHSHESIRGADTVIAYIRLKAEMIRSLSEPVADDRALSEGLINYSETLLKACDGYESLSGNGKLLLGVLSMWGSYGQSGLDEALTAINLAATAAQQRRGLWRTTTT